MTQAQYRNLQANEVLDKPEYWISMLMADRNISYNDTADIIAGWIKESYGTGLERGVVLVTNIVDKDC